MPIRWRLTLMFAAVMAVLLAALIAFLYHHFRSDLDYNINQSLSARAQDIAGLVRQEDAADTSGALRQLPASPDNVVQVLDQSGRVLGATGVLSQPALLQPRRAADAARTAPSCSSAGARFGSTRCRCPTTTRSWSRACRWPNAMRRSTSSTTRC